MQKPCLSFFVLLIVFNVFQHIVIYSEIVEQNITSDLKVITQFGLPTVLIQMACFIIKTLHKTE